MSLKSKVRGHSSKKQSTRVIEYPQAQAASWLLRIMDDTVKTYDDDFFSCVGWCCGGLQWLVTALQKAVADGKNRALRGENLRDDVKKLSRYLHRRIDYYLQEIADDHPVTTPLICELVIEGLERSVRSGAVQPSIIRAIQKFFGLDEASIKICTFAFFANNYNAFSMYFKGKLDLEEYENRNTLAKMLDISPGICSDRIGQLRNMGILDEDSDLQLTSSVEGVWRSGTDDDLETLFCQKLGDSTLPFEACNVKASDRDMVLRLMRLKGTSPRNILLYGAPGTGKTTFACSLARELGVRAWSVPCKDNGSNDDRRVSLTACVRLAGRHKGAFVLVDEAEALLDTDFRAHHRTASSKAWLNEFLERPGQRIIWIINNVEDLDPAVRRRFTYCINFPDLGQRERRYLWRSIAKRQKVSSRLSDTQIDKLSECYQVPVAVMESSMRISRQVASKEDFVSCLERLLKAQVTLQNDGREPRIKPQSSDSYDLRGTCTEQPVEQVVDMCRLLDQRMRDNSTSHKAGMGTMLFYGPPGTGKTALARHLAKILDRPCLVKRASDLLDAYVGGTEKNIADAFAAAESDGAVLVIDEADSFLQAREGAKRSWEVTQVNEFLTQLEHFTGFCICTTNFRNVMDSAAMRRFSFKVPFTYARPEQLEALYQALLDPLACEKTPPLVMDTLKRQTKLAPGDFATVHRQFWLQEPEQITHKALLDSLLKEQKMKLEAGAKKMGF